MHKIKREARFVFDFLQTHRSHIFFIVIAGLALWVVYAKDLQILLNEALQNEAFSHILLLPFIIGFLLYLRKDSIKASVVFRKTRKKDGAEYIDELLGVIFCLIAFLIYWYGSYTFYPLEYHLLSLPILVTGMTLILTNMKALTTLMIPILFLFFLIPIPIGIMTTVGGVIANADTQAAYAGLRAIGIPATLNMSYGPPIITLETAATSPPFAVDLACSGIYSLIAFTMLGTFLVFIVSATTMRKFAMFSLGFLVLNIMNIIRIFSLISVAYWLGTETAMLTFHYVIGMVFTFAGMLLTLFAANKFLKVEILPKTRNTLPCPKCSSNLREGFCLNCGRLLRTASSGFSHKFWLKSLLLLLGCYVVAMTISAPTFVDAKGPAGIASTSAWQNSTSILPQMPDYNLRFLYRDTDYEKIASIYASLVYGYLPVNISDFVVLAGINVGTSISNLHNWEICLVTYQASQGLPPLSNVLDSRDIELLPDVPLIARYLTFEDTRPTYNRTQITLYWYEKAAFNTGLTVEQKYVRISLIIFTKNSTGYQQLENKLFSLGQAIASHWEPLKNQSLVSLGVPAQQTLLATAIVLVVFTKTAEYSNEWKKKNTNLRLFNNFASAKEKTALSTIIDLAGTRKTVETRAIHEAITKKVGKPVRSNTLLGVLSRLEEYGLIKKDIINVGNQPMLVWRV